MRYRETSLAEEPGRRPAPVDPRGDLIVIGGGCYGTYHARQLDRARTAGKIPPREIVIVDRNPQCRAAGLYRGRPGFRFVTATWDGFLDGYFRNPRPDTEDLIVPTPIGPHLMFQWFKRRAESAVGADGIAAARFDGLPDTPYAVQTDTGAGLLSFATWVCPVTCIEPAVCPRTRGPKEWEMDEAVFAYARRRALSGSPYDLVEVFRCRHYAYGVAAFPAAAGAAAGLRLDRALGKPSSSGRPVKVLVATVSSCHGIVNQMMVGATPSESGSCSGPAIP